MVIGGVDVVRMLAVRLLEEVLTVRARQPETWPVCSSCGRPLQSKGFPRAVLQTLFGAIRWRGGGAVPARLCGSQVRRWMRSWGWWRTNAPERRCSGWAVC